MGKLGWIIAIILIILSLLSGVVLGIYTFKGDLFIETPSISYSVQRADLCNPDTAFWVYDTNMISECNAYKHLFAEGYKCVCELQ